MEKIERIKVCHILVQRWTQAIPPAFQSRHTFWVLKVRNGPYIRKLWWGGFEFVTDEYKATTWKYYDHQLAIDWAERNGLERE